MEKYLLLEEKKKIHSLVIELCQKLNKNEECLESIQKQFQTLIKETKDDSIDDLLDFFTNTFLENMKHLLKEGITPAMQVGIQNDFFTVLGYGGTFNGDKNSKEIEKDTFFSFDSVSKLVTSVIIMIMVKEGKIKLTDTPEHINSEFSLNSPIESILKFTAMIKTEKRIDYLKKDETITILKNVRENLELKKEYKNFYEYNDIGYMILRQCINDFLEQLDSLLEKIDSKNLTYQWNKYMDKITGGKLTEEYITQDPKGRDILFPGHTGLYGNIEGIIQLYQKILYSDTILTEDEKKLLFTQPYLDPIVYNKDGTQAIGKNNSYQYMTKVAGIYRKPKGITDISYDKMTSCDMSNLTTDLAKASYGCCGSWVIGDDLSYQNHFGTYVGGILTNPYSMIEPGIYPERVNLIPNSNLTVNQKGTIWGYSPKLNFYKELITEYGLLLELLTAYIQENDAKVLDSKKYKKVRKIEK